MLGLLVGIGEQSLISDLSIVEKCVLFAKVGTKGGKEAILIDYFPL